MKEPILIKFELFFHSIWITDLNDQIDKWISPYLILSTFDDINEIPIKIEARFIVFSAISGLFASEVRLPLNSNISGANYVGRKVLPNF